VGITKKKNPKKYLGVLMKKDRVRIPGNSREYIFPCGGVAQQKAATRGGFAPPLRHGDAQRLLTVEGTSVIFRRARG
jgi:hypothetical protein